MYNCIYKLIVGFARNFKTTLTEQGISPVEHVFNTQIMRIRVPMLKKAEVRGTGIL